MANNYNPDVLNCIANLSNDEVFTPPSLANQVLDLLPQDLFQSPDTTFLDPFTKSGVFLREIVKRLDRGLTPQIPDRQQRIDHILHKQVFGIACTELTSLLSRRSVYCSKHANGKYCVSTFEDEYGNILYSSLNHTWIDGKCKYCGASKAVYDRNINAEQYAYQFIHTTRPESLFNMTFDVIIGNPPYQLSDGGNGASATPIYHLFVNQAIKLSPRYLAMIIPARWLSGGRGLDEFRNEMLTSSKISVLHDFESSQDCFSGVEIKGGVCYFLWEQKDSKVCDVFTHTGSSINHTKRPLLEKGLDIFVRHNEQISVLHKVLDKKEEMLSGWLNPGRFFGFHTKIEWNKDGTGRIQTADGQDFINMNSKQRDKDDVKVYIHGGECWVKRSDIPKNADRVDHYKVLLPRSGNPGSTIIGQPRISEPGSGSSNTFVVVLPPTGAPLSKEQANNLFDYIKTKFFRFLVSAKTTTQSTSTNAYDFVPLQDFSTHWTDELLYRKYNLSAKEIEFIESMISPME